MSDRDRIRREHGLRQAEGYLELNMPQSAIDVLQRLGGPEDMGSQGLYLLGESYRAQEHYREALAPLSAAAAFSPEDPHAPLAMAWCYKRVGKLNQAIDVMERAVEYSPDYAILHYNLACYLSLARRLRRSLCHLSKALTLEPELREIVDEEPDFDPIRTDPGFMALTSIVV